MAIHSLNSQSQKRKIPDSLLDRQTQVSGRKTDHLVQRFHNLVAISSDAPSALGRLRPGSPHETCSRSRIVHPVPIRCRACPFCPNRRRAFCAPRWAVRHACAADNSHKCSPRRYWRAGVVRVACVRVTLTAQCTSARKPSAELCLNVPRRAAATKARVCEIGANPIRLC